MNGARNTAPRKRRARAIERQPKIKLNYSYLTTSGVVVTTTMTMTNETSASATTILWTTAVGPFDAGYGFPCHLHGINIISTTGDRGVAVVAWSCNEFNLNQRQRPYRVSLGGA